MEPGLVAQEILGRDDGGLDYGGENGFKRQK